MYGNQIGKTLSIIDCEKLILSTAYVLFVHISPWNLSNHSLVRQSIQYWITVEHFYFASFILKWVLAALHTHTLVLCSFLHDKILRKYAKNPSSLEDRVKRPTLMLMAAWQPAFVLYKNLFIFTSCHLFFPVSEGGAGWSCPAAVASAWPPSRSTWRGNSWRKWRRAAIWGPSGRHTWPAAILTGRSWCFCVPNGRWFWKQQKCLIKLEINLQFVSSVASDRAFFLGRWWSPTAWMSFL